MARLLELPRRSVVRTARPEVPTPGKNRKVTVLGAPEVTTGTWAYRPGRRCAADFMALLGMLAEAFPRPR